MKKAESLTFRDFSRVNKITITITITMTMTITTTIIIYYLSRGATRGGRPGARPPLAPCRRKNGENQYHRNKKTNRVIVEIIL